MKIETIAVRVGRDIEPATGEVARVGQFGSRRGTLVLHMPAVVPTSRIEPGVYYHFSILNPEQYSDYDRERFIAMLASWGWTGVGPPPEWYP